jgi:hypothetical protein
MNVHQLVILTIITILHNVSVLGNQAMNPSIGTIVVHGHHLLHHLY